MASRQLRRLKQASETLPAGSEDESDTPPKAKPSLFQLLDAEDEDAEANVVPTPSESDEEESVKPQSHTQPGPKALKRRQRRKGKQAGKQELNDKVVPPVEDEDLDKLLEELDIRLQQGAPICAEDSRSALPQSVLAVDPRNLKPEAELRRIFGAKVVSAEAREQDDGANIPGASRRVRRLLARGLLRRVQLKPGILVTPKDHWPPPDGSLSMRPMGPDRNGDPQFDYFFGPAYLAAQEEFEGAQASADPNRLLAFLARRPGHVDGLLAASDFYRAAGQGETAEDLLARALYALEAAWPPQFCATADRCRVRPEAPQNDGLWRALFRHVQLHISKAGLPLQSLTSRGLYSTALENAKLLLSLDHNDAAAVLLCIDYLAIKAGQYGFLQALAAQLDPAGDDFAVFPNWTYSLALAAFLAESGGALERANEEVLMQGARAVMFQPGVVAAVIERLVSKSVRVDAEFQALLRHPLFESDGVDSSADLAHLTAIYVERQSALYKDPRILAWLKRCCQLATRPGGDGERASWAAARAQIFPPSDVNRFAALRVSRYSDDVAALPEEELQALAAQGQAGDAAAAEDIIQEIIRNGDAQQLRDLAGADGAPIEGESVASALLRTLLPWVNIGADPGLEEARGANGAGGEEDQPDGNAQ